jgi:hypothetical protein
MLTPELLEVTWERNLMPRSSGSTDADIIDPTDTDAPSIQQNQPSKVHQLRFSVPIAPTSSVLLCAIVLPI